MRRDGTGARAWWLFQLSIVNGFAMCYVIPTSVRRAVLRAVGYDIGHAHIKSGSIVRSLSLTVGDGSFVNHRCIFEQGDISVGRDVFISTGVTLAAGDHRMGGHSKRAGASYHLPIVIKDGCWLGANVVVLRGVTIAAGCVIGAGAVVISDTEPDGVYAGVPARRVRDLE